MCGIFGYEGRTDLLERMSPILAIYMNDRGRDSWGVTDGTFIYKSVGPIVDQFDELNLESPTYHCRAASVGAVSVRNAHPFEFTGTRFNGDTKRVVGVHNGHLSNWVALKHRIENRKDFEVDSEHIFAHLAEDRPTTDIEGWGAVVWYEQINNEPISRYFSKFGTGDISIAKMTTGEIVFASTQRAIEVAARMARGKVDIFYKVEPHYKYTIIDNELKDCGEMKWGQPYVQYVHNTYGSHFLNQPSYTSDICAIKDCHHRVADSELICLSCLMKIKKDYGFSLGDVITSEQALSNYSGYY